MNLTMEVCYQFSTQKLKEILGSESVPQHCGVFGHKLNLFNCLSRQVSCK